MSERTCAFCAALIKVHPRERNRRKWCSEACRRRGRMTDPAVAERTRELRRRSQRARFVPVDYPERPCADCGEMFKPKTKRTSYCYDRTCRNRRTRRQQDQDNLRALKRQANARRRAARRNVEVEEFDHREIFERDGWICGICLDPVDPELEWPDLMSASLDHIIPLSRLGPHTRANVQCSHFICNSEKSDRVA